MQLEVDYETNTITVEGIRIAIPALLTIVHPDPRALYRFERFGNTIQVRNVGQYPRGTHVEGALVH